MRKHAYKHIACICLILATLGGCAAYTEAWEKYPQQQGQSNNVYTLPPGMTTPDGYRMCLDNETGRFAKVNKCERAERGGYSEMVRYNYILTADWLTNDGACYNYKTKRIVPLKYCAEQVNRPPAPLPTPVLPPIIHGGPFLGLQQGGVVLPLVDGGVGDPIPFEGGPNFCADAGGGTVICQ